MGLALGLLVYAVAFARKLAKLTTEILSLADADAVLSMLGLIDAALVASLIVMVMISGYENFVGSFDGHDSELSWLGKIDAGSLKIKVASTIVLISSIHLLQIFLNSAQYSPQQLMWVTIMHMAFVFSALLLGVLDRIVMGRTVRKKTEL
jgi:uncharacterized protein (TIGR00645 family)